MRPDAIPAVVHVYAFPRWKWSIVRQCLPNRRLVFLKPNESAVGASALLLWGATPPPPDTAPSALLLRAEDGFLRSVGLGADLIRPVSWAIDSLGIYYDATRPSELEMLLAESQVTAAQCERAARLRARIVEARLTKYNVGTLNWVRPVATKTVILVPGQVESDASLAYGAPATRTNVGLLRLVRAARPEAYLIYKPHPDVVARLRAPGVNEGLAADYCDEIVVNISMAALLDAVDEVHVLTSLSGFEALLREKPVTCYGHPFYAGWGLTHDWAPHDRRHRRLSLNELVAASLIEYPLYLARDRRTLTTPESALESLLSWRDQSGGRETWWRGVARAVLRRVGGVK